MNGSGWGALASCFGAAIVWLAAAPASAAQEEPTADVRGEIALSSLISLSDGHLSELADAFRIFAESREARSADWKQIEGPLAIVAKANVPALVWFALPDGSYWSVEQGKASARLSDRPYFPRVLAGETVIGALVVSKATGKSSAIVAVPVKGEGEKVVGVLGSSVYLDRLSELVKAEMGLGPREIFYSFDETPLLAVEWDPNLILADPMTLGPEIRKVFQEMLSKDEGRIRYTFRGKVRTVLYRRSKVTGWWYAFGVLSEPVEK